jgi:hypothetical protein
MSSRFEVVRPIPRAGGRRRKNAEPGPWGHIGDMGDPLSIYGFLSRRGAAFPISSRFHDFERLQFDQVWGVDRGFHV